MISRYPIICPGCNEPFLVRLGVAPTKLTRFYVPCPACKLPIRGTSQGKELESHKVEFEAEWYKGEAEPARIVTVDPNVPSRYEATQMGGLGTAPTMTLATLVGDERVLDLFMYMSRGQQVVEELWPQVRRIYEYYLERDWARFDSAGEAAFTENWPSVSTEHERATLAHQALAVALANIVDDDVYTSAMFLRRYMRKHIRALDSAEYIAFARTEVGSGSVPGRQRALFELLDLFIQRYESWQIGLLPRLMPEDRLPLLEDLRLFRDEFDILRDLYQQGFEMVCKMLHFPMAAQNTVKRGRPDDFGSDVPPTLERKSNPTTLKAFDRLSSFDKLQYVAEVPGWDGWVNLLDNKTRNAIGHATARHDLRTGLVLSDTVPSGVPYLDLVADVYDVFDALSICPQLLRMIRIVASPDF